MLPKLNQPKGSTIGVLKDGRTIQEAFDLGSSYLTYRSNTVDKVLGRFQSIGDWGQLTAPNGYHSVLTQVWNSQQDEDAYHRGGLAIGKAGFGVRMNATALSLRMSNEGVNSWNVQVTGINDNVALAKYGSPDKVTFYCDIASGAAGPGESIFVADTYTTDGFTTTDAAVLAAAKRGTLLRSVSPGGTVRWNIVDRVEGNTVIGWKPWASTGGDSVPPDGSTVEVNPEGKLWASNINAIWNVGGRSKGGVIGEWGVMIRDTGATGVNGLDLVNLPGSAQEGDTGILIRGGGAQDRFGWKTGASVRGFSQYGISILYDNTSASSQADLYLNGLSAADIRHRGNAKSYGELYMYSGGAFDNTMATAKSPIGYTIKSGNQMVALNGAGEKTLTANSAGEYIFNPAAGMVLVCPSTNGISAGYELMLSAVGTSGTTQITIRAQAAGPIVYTEDGQGNSTTWTPKKMKRYVLKWDGTNWYVLG